MRNARFISMTRARHERYGARLDLPADVETWHDLASCNGHSHPDLWFPVTRDRHNPEVVLAKEICADCPVADLCFDEGMRLGERHGQIRGGIAFIQGHSRKRLRELRAKFVAGGGK